MKIPFVGISVAILLTGCQQKPDEVAMAECWGSDAKAELIKLSKDSISQKITALLKAGGETVDADMRARIEASLEVSADNYYVVSIDRTADSVHCGAQVSMKFTKQGGKVLSAEGAYVDFDIYRGEHGKIYSIPTTMPLVQLVTDATGLI